MSTAEQLYMGCISAGWGKEDDCVLVRLYLPGRENLVAQLAKPSDRHEPSTLSVNDIKDLMVGVHLAGMSEAMSFCDHLGVDSDLMFDVVSDAAGSSSVFLRTFSDMQCAKWSLKAIAGIEDIRKRLVCPGRW